MIVHSIKRPGLIAQVVQQVSRVPLALIPYRYMQPNRMDKIAYGKWLEEMKKDWDVGELVTLKGVACIPNVAPFHYRITYIDELWHQVPYDLATAEPLALTCRTNNGVYMSKGPSMLRHLTAQEVVCVNLSNIKTLGNA